MKEEVIQEMVAANHIAEQAIMLEMLRARGYRAEFARGFEEAKNLIGIFI